RGSCPAGSSWRSSSPGRRGRSAWRGGERRVALARARARVAAVLLALVVPLLTRRLLGDDEYWIQVLIWVMFFAYLSAAWNLIGGFAGQYSIGHAGARRHRRLHLLAPRHLRGPDALARHARGRRTGGRRGGVIGYPCFRLRGAFFSLVTIAFAEMLRVGLELTDSVAGMQINGVRGFLLPVLGDRPAQFQFASKRPYYYVMLALLVVVLLAGAAVKRARLGYYLAAIRDDEDAVASLGINPARVKLAAMMLSSFFAAVGGTFYAQLVGFITPTRTMSLA